MTISPARRSAFEILRRVESEAAFASVLLAGLDRGMRDDDRRLSHELVLGVLRRRLWLDQSLEHLASRGFETLDLSVRLALELGLYQLRFLSRIPISAAVNESVNLVRAAGVSSAASLVNAVLRRATREPDYDPAASIKDPNRRLSVETSHPQWLIDRWVKDFGFDEAASLARANNQPPAIAFRLTAQASTGKSGAQIFKDLETAGANVLPSVMAPDSWRVIGAGGAVRKLVRDGLIYLQDEASQLIAHLLQAEAGHRVLDVTAAPGSKATHIASLAPEATIFAGDLHQHRIQTMRELAKTQRARINLLIHDAAQPLPFPDKSFDRVLLDAPCSGTGTLRRHPEICWRLKPEDIDELSSQQLMMLSNSADSVRAGGRIIYSTCSVEVEENEFVIQEFLASRSDFTRVKLDVAAELQTETGDVRTWPHRQGVDGFFIAAFQRKI
jgi:16S rRNA (cytosine967-C5)-methyltransferase